MNPATKEKKNNVVASDDQEKPFMASDDEEKPYRPYVAQDTQKWLSKLKHLDINWVE